jgi:hypothetical protein
VLSADIGETSVILRWKTEAENPVDSIHIVPANPTAENPKFGFYLTSTDINAGYVLVNNLVMNSTYSATIYNTNATEGYENYNSVTFRTIGPPEGAIIVGPKDDLGTMFTTALNDSQLSEITFFLTAGASYYMTNVTGNETDGYQPTAVGKNYNINKSVTFMAAPGERPTLYIKSGKWAFTGSADHFIVDGVNIKEIITESTPFSASSYFFNMSAPAVSATINEFIIKNSDIDLPRSLIMLSGSNDNTVVISSILIDNVTHTSSGPHASSGGHAFIQCQTANYDVWKDITISNSTFYNVPKMRGLFQRVGAGAFASSPKINIENCTFYYYSTVAASTPEGGSAFFIAEMQNAVNPDITVTNCLFANQLYGMVRMPTSGGNLTQSDNYYLNDCVGEKTGSGAGSLTPTPVDLSSSDVFTDPVNGDYTIKDKTSAIYTNSVGDPRWIK